MDYKQLKKLLFQYECEYPKTHLTAYITFSSFGPDNKQEYSWNSRTYLISSDNKAFQPNKGGYSIFGSCLDGTDQCMRLEQYIQEEYGGRDDWAVEDCGIVAWLLIECSECSISAPKLFYTRHGALERMLSRLADLGELDADQLKKDYTAAKELFEDGYYGADQDSAWLAERHEDWHWSIQPVYISSPLNISFGHE